MLRMIIPVVIQCLVVHVGPHFTITRPAPQLEVLLLRRGSCKALQDTCFLDMVRESDQDRMRTLSLLGGSASIHVHLLDSSNMPLSVQLFFSCFPAEEDDDISALIGVREDIEDRVFRAPPELQCSTAVAQIPLGDNVSDGGATETVSSGDFPPLMNSEGRELGEVSAWINVLTRGLPVLKTSAGFLLIAGPHCGPRPLELLESIVNKESFMLWIQEATNNHFDITCNDSSSCSTTFKVVLRQPTSTETSFGLTAKCMIDFSMEPDEQLVADNPDCDLDHLVYIEFHDLKQTRIRRRHRGVTDRPASACSDSLIVGTESEARGVPTTLGRSVLLI